MMHERVVQAQARLSVAIEILAYHAVAPADQVLELQVSYITAFVVVVVVADAITTFIC